MTDLEQAQNLIEETRYRIRIDVTLDADSESWALSCASAWLEHGGEKIDGVGGCCGTLTIEEVPDDRP